MEVREWKRFQKLEVVILRTPSSRFKPINTWQPHVVKKPMTKRWLVLDDQLLRVSLAEREENVNLVQDEGTSTVALTPVENIPAVESINGPGVETTGGPTTEIELDSFETVMDTERVRRKVQRSMALVSHGFNITPSCDAFFSRPVVISTVSWSSASIESEINPHQLWVNDPMVMQRLKGNLYWRGTLNLRFDLAASPHQYGLMRASYRHMQVPNPVVPPYNPWGIDFDQNTGISCASQKFGVDFDAAVPGGKEIAIPWIYPYECVPTVVTDQLDWIGKLVFTPIIALQRDDSATSGTVVIVVRAWMTDMVLWGATRCSAVAQAPQRGMVGGMADLVVRGANALTGIPELGSIAKAVSKGATLVRTVADYFGFSRPAKFETQSVMQRNMTSMALTDTVVVADSCAFSKHCKLDTNMVDEGYSSLDEMALTRIFSHDSIVQTATWSQSQGRGTTVMSVYCDPTCSLTAGSFWDVTSLAYGCLPFCFWRGSLVFCFRVVSSQFHTGKLRVYYEPGTTPGGVEDATWPLAALENCTLDCAPGSCGEVVVGWTSQSMWLPIGTTFTASPGSSAASIGKLVVVVENTLVAPLSSSTIGIVVSVKGGPDFRVFGVKTDLPGYAVQTSGPSFADPVEEIKEEGFVGQSALIPNRVPYEVCHVGGDSSNTGLTNRVFGEEMLSLRALLKRYTCGGYAKATSTVTSILKTKQFICTFPMYPPDYGHTATGGNGINYVATNNLFRWFRIGYIGCRGSMRYRVSDGNPYSDQNAAVVYPASFTMFISQNPGVATSLAASDTIYLGAPRFSGVGAMVANGILSHEADFTIPDYYPLRFTPMLARTADVVHDSITPFVCLTVQKQVQAMETCSFPISHAIGDDFSFFGWQGPPNVKSA